MAEFLPPVILEIQAKATEAIASMQKVNGELDKMEAKALKAGGSLGVMEKASKYSGVALVGLAGAFGVMAAAGIKAALNVADAQAKLKTAVQDTGVSFANFTPYMDQSVASMAKLGFKSEDTITALAQMTAATRNPQTALDMLSTAADLAAFKHESLAAAADTVSRAAMGQARGLATLGIALGKTIPKGASVAQIMQAIQDRTKGAAAEAAKADPWKVLTAQFGLLEEKLGIALLPAFKNLVNWITGPGINGLEKIGGWISRNKGLFEALAATLATLWLAPKVDALLLAIGAIGKAWFGVAAAADAAAVSEGAASAAGGASGVGGFTKALPFLGVPFALEGAIQYAGNRGPKNMTYQGRSSRDPRTWLTPDTKIVQSNAKTLKNINSGIDLSKIIAGNTSAKKTKTTKGKSASIHSQETGVINNIIVNYDGTKVATQKSLYGGK